MSGKRKTPGSRAFAVPGNQFCNRFRISGNDYFPLGKQHSFCLGPVMA
jgi:hypothetical protein